MKLSILIQTLGALASLAIAGSALAQKKYDSGASDTEIKIGQTTAYSGPASAYSSLAKAASAYFDKINAEGGINGRKIKLVSVDDGYNPAKTVEQTRKLVEQEEVLLTFYSLGTPAQSAVHKYLNQQKMPQLFVASGATKWGDPKHFPWTMGWQPSYAAEGRMYAKYILKNNPNAKIGILYQNDDFGKDYLEGFEAGLGDKAKSMIVSKLSYEVTDPTADSQVVSLKAAGADTFLNISTAKFAAQTIKKVAAIGWKPTHYLVSVSNSVGNVMKPAGPEAATGIISSFFLKDPTDPTFQKGKEWDDYVAFMKKYYPTGDMTDTYTVNGYSVAQTMVEVLKKAGDNLTRANVMKQAASLDMPLPMLLPGVRVKTGPDDFFPVDGLQLGKFDGKTWVLFGEVMEN